MEPLDPAWPDRRDGMDEILLRSGKEAYGGEPPGFLLTAKTPHAWSLREQIMVYLCVRLLLRAVYNDNPYGKMKWRGFTILVEDADGGVACGENAWRACDDSSDRNQRQSGSSSIAGNADCGSGALLPKRWNTSDETGAF